MIQISRLDYTYSDPKMRIKSRVVDHPWNVSRLRVCPMDGSAHHIPSERWNLIILLSLEPNEIRFITVIFKFVAIEKRDFTEIIIRNKTQQQTEHINNQ